MKIVNCIVRTKDDRKRIPIAVHDFIVFCLIREQPIWYPLFYGERPDTVNGFNGIHRFLCCHVSLKSNLNLFANVYVPMNLNNNDLNRLGF